MIVNVFDTTNPHRTQRIHKKNKKTKKTPNPLKAIHLVALSYLAANTHCNIVYMQL